MANPMRGEVEVTLDGVPHLARLTLGALVELETELAAGSLLALAERFEDGRFSAGDVLSVLVAGLRGGGWQGDRNALLTVEIGGGTVGAAQAAARLLHHAFSLPE